MKNWKWVESSVDRSGLHIQLTYGDITGDKPDHLTPVTIVGPPSGNIFPVQFLLSGATPAEKKMVDAVKQDLDFFLVQKKEQNPWGICPLPLHHGSEHILFSSLVRDFNG